jgi:hypothetical protein
MPLPSSDPIEKAIARYEESRRSEPDFKIAALGIFVVLVLCWLGFLWCSAEIQAGVYRRQGVEMSTWECFMGAKPAERTFKTLEQP